KVSVPPPLFTTRLLKVGDEGPLMACAPFPLNVNVLVPAVNVPLEKVKVPPMFTLLLPALNVPPAIVTLLSTLTVLAVLMGPAVVFRVGEVLPVNVMPSIVMLLPPAALLISIPPVSVVAVLLVIDTPVKVTVWVGGLPAMMSDAIAP